jgi:hypothetical protein
MALPDSAMDASRTGAPLRPEGEVQVASAAADFLKLLNNLKRAPRVPTPIEERAAGKGAYEARQREGAQQLLSPEGQQRFSDANNIANEAIRPDPTVRYAEDALNQQPEQVVAGAREGLRGVDPATMETSPRVAAAQPGATEIDAGDAIRLTSETRVDDFIRNGSEGVDFNFDRIETGDDVKLLVNTMSDIYASPIEAAKRGIQTNLETTARADELLADELGLTRTLLKRKTGDLLNAEQMTAARVVLVRSAERLIDLATAIRDGDTTGATMVKFRRQMAIHAGIQMQVKGAQTEIARSLQAMRIPAAARTLEDVAKFQEIILQESGGRKAAAKMAQAVLKANATGGRAQVHKVAMNGWKRADGIFAEVYVNGLLSWFPTHVKNFVGTPLFMAAQLPEELLAGVYGGMERGIRRAVGAGRDEEGVYVGQAAARVIGYTQAVRDAFVTAARTIATEDSADALNKIEGASFKNIRSESSGPFGRFFNALGKVVRLPSAGLMGADDFWKVFAQRGELYAQAYGEGRQALRLGKSQQEATDNLMMAILDPRSYAGELDEFARYSTLTSDTGWLGKIGRDIQKIPFFGRMYVPFVTAPTNSILRYYERMVPNSGVLKDPVARQKALARLTIGWGASYGLYSMAIDGRITGAYPREQSQRDLLPPKWQPYSFVFRGDNWPTDEDGDPLPLYDRVTGAPNGSLTYVSYAGIEPVGALIGIAAETAERMRRTNDPEARQNIASAAIGAGLKYLTDLPMLQSIGDIMEVLERGDLTKLARSPIGGMMPFSSAVRAVERSIDPTIRKPSGSYDYYTLEDVQEMGPDESGLLQTDLIGTVKGGFVPGFFDGLAQLKAMLTERPLYGGASDEETGIQYDILGRARESSVRFDVSPVRAFYNLAMPFDISVGEAPGPVYLAHIELGGPLRMKKEKSGGFRFTEALQAQWVNAAKNEVMLPDARGQLVDFRTAMTALVLSPSFLRVGRTETPEQRRTRQRNAMRNLEDEYFDAGLERTLARPENQDVYLAYRDYTNNRNRAQGQ